MRRWRIYCLLCFAQLAVGCSLSPPKDAVYFQEDTRVIPGYAKVYIYRPSMGFGAGVWPEVHLNGENVVGLRNGAYTVIFAKPGKYTITTAKNTFLSGMGNIPGEVDISTDGEYFLLLDRDNCQNHYMNAYCLFHPHEIDYQRWTIVPKNAALRQLRECYFVKPYLEQIPSGA